MGTSSLIASARSRAETLKQLKWAVIGSPIAAIRSIDDRLTRRQRTEVAAASVVNGCVCVGMPGNSRGSQLLNLELLASQMMMRTRQRSGEQAKHPLLVVMHAGDLRPNLRIEGQTRQDHYRARR
jgi:hypothetical protein